MSSLTTPAQYDCTLLQAEYNTHSISLPHFLMTPGSESMEMPEALAAEVPAPEAAHVDLDQAVQAMLKALPA